MFCVIGFSNLLSAQSTDDMLVRVKLKRVTLIDIEPNNNLINLPVVAPSEAGSPAEGNTDDSRWLNYTCCLKSGDADRYITVSLGSSSIIPPGLSLSLTASSYSGTGNGVFGTPSGTLVLSTASQTLISGIRGAFTGNGVSNGHKLTYNLEISDYSQLDFDNSTSIQVVFTITN